MEKDFETEDFQFTPPEFDMTLAGENVDTDTSFTAPSVENTLEEEVQFENPSLEVEVIPEAEVEAKINEDNSEKSFDDFDNVMPKPEDLTQFEVAPQDKIETAQTEDIQENTAEATSDENFDEVMSNFEPPAFEFEVIPEAEVEAKADENKSEQSFDNFDEVMPNPEDLTQFEVAPVEETVDIQPEDAQGKVANAIREKMSEMQSSNTPDVTGINDEAPSFEPVIDEEIQISPSTEPYQEEQVSKDNMFVEGNEKLKNMIKSESQQSINIVKEEVLTK